MNRCPPRAAALRLLAVLLLLLPTIALLAAPDAGGGAGDGGEGCPSGSALAAAVRSLPLDRTTRARELASPLPDGLLERALERPGEVAVARQGQKGFALSLVPLPRRLLWRAVNDEDRYGEALGLEVSRVVGGTPRGTERILFQAFQRLGVGRWWVDRVRLNGRLQKETGGALWELVWTDAFGAWDPESRLPEDPKGWRELQGLVHDLQPLEWTRGAWVMAEPVPGCTLVDYFLWSDPGGMLSALQALGAKGAIRNTVEGLIRHARTGVEEVAPGEPPFVDPSGEPLSGGPVEAPLAEPPGAPPGPEPERP